MKYYAVANGFQTGIFTDWAEVTAAVSGYSGAVYRKFESKEDAEAWLHPPKAKKEEPVIIPTEKLNLIYTDGSCDKEGKGGYGIVIIPVDGPQIEYYGHVLLDKCTNNRAELYAIYVALCQVKGDSIIVTDSTYAIGCFVHWLTGWIARGWRDVQNVDLIQAILKLMEGRSISFRHVKGHSGDVYNERCDELARMGRLLEPSK